MKTLKNIGIGILVVLAVLVIIGAGIFTASIYYTILFIAKGIGILLLIVAVLYILWIIRKNS